MDKVWFVTMYVGYSGMDGHDILIMPADASEDDVQEEAYQMAVEHASLYGYYPPSFDDYAGDDEDEDDIDSEYVSENIEGYAVPYEPEEHDKFRAGGGSFMDEAAYKRAFLAF